MVKIASLDSYDGALRAVIATACLIATVSVASNALADQVPSGKVSPAPRTIHISSPAFEHNESIPAKYTCEGEDVSLPLAWKNLPEGARSLVLIVDDPDVPGPAEPQKRWVHWVLLNIPPSVAGLGEGMSTDLPAGVVEGSNGWKRTGYGGPCPPIGRHRYYHRIYALDVELEGLESSNGGAPGRGAVLEAMQGHVLAWGELMGTYRKAR